MNPLSIIQLLVALKSLGAASTPPPPPKSGATSTEFWLTGIVSAWAAFSPMVLAPYSILIPAGAIGLYTIARTVLKVAHMLGQAKALPDLPDLPVSIDKQAPAPVTDLRPPPNQ